MNQLGRCIGSVLLLAAVQPLSAEESVRPNIILVMADDQGWGQTGYCNHPVLETPNLDAMAAKGLRFDRFYAGAPVCSPTRASVLTGRSNNRTGVETHGYALRLQETTIAAALRAAGYATGHFGKWHLNGLRGPGVPILAGDTHNPGAFGFDEWLSVTNFFDRDPILSRQGEFIEYQGDSSEIVVDEALKFIGRQAAAAKPSFTVIWYGTPHSPFRASEKDRARFTKLDANSQDHYGELVAMDRSIGTLRQGLRDLDIADDTLVWFCSDNGGLPKITPETVGGLRGFKGTLYEGGLRVPAIIEWPAGIKRARITQYPAVTMDIFPTLADIVGLPKSVMLQPQDGISLRTLFTEERTRRDKPIPFSCFGNTALIDNNYKLLHTGRRQKQYELYDLSVDPKEEKNLFNERTAVAKRLKTAMDRWNESLAASVAGKDYPEGTVNPGEPEPRFWMDVEAYRPYFDQWKKRPEYESRFNPRKRKP
ncbi:MAG: sulfatase-like hydrolase/transferase [Planctomycetes bacterium]|nr:sulfatase-like hydrolase/transferase [Planctomycetota bacterium]MBL7040643.1 sulfatase-like hydrolase/transferase [Pirellulaceae bacterium]